MLSLDQDAVLCVLSSGFGATVREIDTEIASYRKTLCVKQMHDLVKTAGLKFYERQQLFQDRVRGMLQRESRALCRVQCACKQLRDLGAMAKVRCMRTETLIVGKLAVAAHLYRNALRNCFRTAAQHVFRIPHSATLEAARWIYDAT